MLWTLKRKYQRLVVTMKNKNLRLIRYDLVCGYKYNFKKLIIAVLFVLFNCILFSAMVSRSMKVYGYVDVTLMDYLIYFFKGAKATDFDMGVVNIPVVFLGIQILIASMVGYYPFDDIYGYGKQVFIRVEKKTTWWISKCVWAFVTVLSFYAILYAIVLLYCLITGQDMSMTYHHDIVNYMDQAYIGAVKKSDMLLYVFVMPVIYSLMISFAQMTVSMLLNPIISFLFVMIYNIMGILLMSKGLLANYSMLLRNELSSGYDIKSMEGIIYMIIPMIVSIIVGLIVIRRKEIFEK